MPGPPDAKIILNEGARATAEGRCEFAARESAIDACVKAGNMTAADIEAFGEISHAFASGYRKLKATALEAQDKLLLPALKRR